MTDVLLDGTASAASARPCSRAACSDDAVVTLTYDYRDAMAVVGPLSVRHEPHSYDLCVRHAGRLSVPRGWQVVRHMALEDG